MGTKVDIKDVFVELFELVERYNQLIRESDALRHANEPECPAKAIPLYKDERYSRQLKRLLRAYQDILDSSGSLPLESICDLAKEIVNGQNFCDGNHRTALFLCYHLTIYLHDALPRIAPHLLYAAIDFEYLKSMHGLSGSHGHIFDSNAIYIALHSRAISEVHAPSLKKSHLDNITSAIIKMPSFIDNLAKKVRIPNHLASITVQEKLFRQFLGFRPGMEHSSAVCVSGYCARLAQIKLIDLDFNPTWDIYNPQVRQIGGSIHSFLTSLSKPQTKNETHQKDVLAAWFKSSGHSACFK